MKNHKVAAARRPGGTTEIEEIRERVWAGRDTEPKKQSFVIMEKTQTQSKFSKMADMVADSAYWVRNEPIPFGLDLFPSAANLFFMRYADLFYKHATGGPIYIDTPGSQTEIAYCEKKLAAYKERGVRYTYIKAGDELSDIMMRIEPLPKGVSA